jgi:hypothetical protein
MKQFPYPTGPNVREATVRVGDLELNCVFDGDRDEAPDGTPELELYLVAVEINGAWFSAVDTLADWLLEAIDAQYAKDRRAY